jgi:AraC-like DNA-binding protein
MVEVRLLEGEYFGKKQSAIRIGRLILSESVYLPATKIPRHSHENAYMILTVAGTQQEELGKGHRIYEPNTLALHPAQETHAQVIGPAGWRCLHIEFGSDWIEQNPHVSFALKTLAHFKQNELSLVTAGIYREFVHRDEASQLAIEGAVLRALCEIYRNSCAEERKSPPRWLRQARDLLHDRHSETLSLQNISECVGVHPVHLAREFRRHYQTTVAAYVRRLRIQSAAKAMCEGDLPLSEVALNCGFADQAHFCRVFKQVVGLTPREFRFKAHLR